MGRFYISLCLLLMMLAGLGCVRTDDRLARENTELKSRIVALETQLTIVTAQPVAMGRELQTFEDMYTACQREHPDWRFLGTE